MEPRDLSEPLASRSRGLDEDVLQLESLSIHEIARRCSDESNKFLKRSISEGSFCLELFRRAIIQHDEDAWAYLYQQYTPLVLTWILQYRSAIPLLGHDAKASLVNAAFAKFSQALTPVKMEKFDSLSAILQYLKMCVHSVIADEMRACQERQCEEAFDTREHEWVIDDPADDVISSIVTQGLWQAVQGELHDESERILVDLAYIHGMKPREISHLHRHLFTTVDDVYRIKRNILERLRRNRRLQMMFWGHDH